MTYHTTAAQGAMQATVLTPEERAAAIAHLTERDTFTTRDLAIERAVVSKLRAPVATDWRSMDTAPLDGREVLLQVELRAGMPGRCLVGHYMPGGHCIEDHPPIAQGWYFWDGREFDLASKPTGWLALPPDDVYSALASAPVAGEAMNLVTPHDWAGSDEEYAAAVGRGEVRAFHRFGATDAALQASEAVRQDADAIGKLKAKFIAEDAACRTLTRMGYTWHGGEEWKPALGDSKATMARLDASEALEVARTALMEIADLADVDADQRGVIVNRALTTIAQLTASPQASEVVCTPVMTVAEFCAEAGRLGLTADTLAAQLAARPEFADCLPKADKNGGKCRTCGRTGVVDDGEITSSVGIEFENGPIKCVKDCPDCSAVQADRQQNTGDIIPLAPYLEFMIKTIEESRIRIGYAFGSPVFCMIKEARAALSAQPGAKKKGESDA